ncbi:MAG: hypothetical protein HOJ16_07520 [Candidatus Peribacter sp.]|jgi:hypothetical protein|nr:hypothetical protein [Candidatus Peribacter sp.]MDB4335926.1 hypothetical protein [bacterium]
MSKIERGKLFYAPSGIMMFGKNVINKLEAPAVMINIKDMDNFYETYFDGAKYLVRKRDVFPIEEGVKYDVKV